MKTPQTRDALDVIVAEMRDVLELAQKWLANSIPVCELDGPKPLPVIAKALDRLAALSASPVVSPRNHGSDLVEGK